LLRKKRISGKRPSLAEEIALREKEKMPCPISAGGASRPPRAGDRPDRRKWEATEKGTRAVSSDERLGHYYLGGGGWEKRRKSLFPRGGKKWMKKLLIKPESFNLTLLKCERKRG